jgi:tripartite-type tricarboxylate transporter receptor subunit TctC
MKRVIFSAAGMLMAATLAVPAAAEDFYKDKTIEFVVVFAPSGNYDSYTRLVARYIGKHIPGNPNTIVKNMPGAGGVVGANHLYNIAARDGTVMGMIAENAPLGQLFETKGIRYDSRKFTWIGRVVSNSSVFITWHTSKIKTADDLFNKEVIAGAGGPTSNSQIIPRVLDDLLGTKFKLITGYKSQGDIILAMQKGEIDGGTRPWTDLKSTNADWIRDKKVNLIVHFGTERQPEVPNVPTVLELTKTKEQHQILALILGGGEIGRSIMAPPEVPADRAAILRKAFDATMKDPDLLAYTKKANIDIEPLPASKLEEIVKEFFDTPPDVVKKAAELVAPSKR